MTARFRRVAVFVGAAALAAGAGVGVAATQGDATNRSGGAIQQPGGPGGGRFDLSTVADMLGVSEAELQRAIQDARPTAGGPDTMFAAVARSSACRWTRSVRRLRQSCRRAVPAGRVAGWRRGRSDRRGGGRRRTAAGWGREGAGRRGEVQAAVAEKPPYRWFIRQASCRGRSTSLAFRQLFLS